MKSLTLIDGSGFIFRAYHTMPPLTNLAGTPVGAVYGFTNMLCSYLEKHKPDAVLVVFDAARYTFRNRLYEAYKANRDATPEDLIPQFALTREAARALGLPVAEVVDVEADDVIAAYVKAACEQGIQVTIVSSDKDLMQLVSDCVSMYDPMKQKTIGPAEVEEKFGVPPHQVVEVLALMGDSSDNVPGVPGIGPKTAAQLIAQYGDVETLLARVGEIPQQKRRESLAEHAAMARLSHQLVTLKDDVALPYTFAELSPRAPDPEVLAAFLTAQGFKSLQVRLKQRYQLPDAAPAAAVKTILPGEEGTVAAVQQPRNYSLVQDEAELQKWLKWIRREGLVVVDVETTSLDAMSAKLVGISLCLKAGEACYIPLEHVVRDGQAVAADDLFAAPQQKQPGQLDKRKVLDALAPLLEDPAIVKIAHNAKYDALIFKQLGISMAPLADTMLMSYAMNAGLHPHGMDFLAQRYLGITAISYDDVTGTGKSRRCFSEVELEKAMEYAAEDADITLQLYQYFSPLLHQCQVQTLYSTIEAPLVPVIVAMEQRGIRVSADKLKALSSQFETEMTRLEKGIYVHAGEEFNIASPKQLGEILYDKMALDGGKKSSKTGAYTTDAATLEELAEQGVELARDVLEWRQMAKLKSTYTDALVQQIHPVTGRVHTSYSMAVASTGRLSSSDPNLQNIPIRTELGRLIRTAFVAQEGHMLISADYSQIELRLLAHMADIAALKQAFKEGRDIHTATAADMFGYALDSVPPEARRQAKMINFGIIYGISAHGLATRLGIGRTEAADYIQRYFERYPGIRRYMDETKQFAREHGFVTTLYGRRCHVPGITDKNGARRQFSERAAINAPLQGTAADIIKRAMIAVEADLSTHMPQCRMLLQVHDELVFEVPTSEAAAAIARIVPKMEKVAALSVPLTVEAKAGTHWGEAH